MRVDSARYVLSALNRSDFIEDHLPQIAFVGRSNVGKSSLLNRLLGRKALARISSTPGRTRAINYFLVNDRFYFVDLPGYGYAKVGKQTRREWARLMDEYFRTAAERAHVIQLVDAKVGATPLDVDAFEYLESVGCEPTVVATRADRVSQSRRAKALAAIRSALPGLATGQPVPVSARSGEGVKDVWREIGGFLTAEPRKTQMGNRT